MIYKIKISRWPFESGLRINESITGRPKTLASDAISEGVTTNFKKGTVKIGAWKQEKEVQLDAKSVIFKGNFAKGKTNMSVWFTNADNVDWGAFYIKLTREI